MPGELVLKRREPKRRAVFLDRDGVINALVFHEDAGVIDSPMNEEQFKLLPRVPKAIRLLNEAGVLVIVVSNQPAVARGRYSMEMLERVEHKLENELAKAGARIDAAYYCVHHPTAPILKWRKKCTCRKPGIGMLKKASQRFSLSLQDCYMVGDNQSDIVAGQRAGCKTIFIGRCLCDTCPLQKGGRTNADFTARDLWSAVRMIREQEASA
jgi:D-glycero-D-manno-heptose 1,7-bisphosphate phosphatase